MTFVSVFGSLNRLIAKCLLSLLVPTIAFAQTNPEVYYETPRWDFISDDGVSSSSGEFDTPQSACSWGIAENNASYSTSNPYVGVDPIALQRWRVSQTQFNTFLGRTCNTYARKATAVPSCRDGYIARVTPAGPDIRCVREDLVDPDECDVCSAGIAVMSGPPDPQVGNPISIRNGAKTETETDYATSDGLLNVSRLYRSSLPSQTRLAETGDGLGFGRFWYGLLPGRLVVTGDNFGTLEFLGPNGTITSFNALSAFNYTSSDATRLTLSFPTTPTGTPAQFFQAAAVANGPAEIKLAMANGDYILFRRSDDYDQLTQVRHLVPIERGFASGYKQTFVYPGTGRYPDKIQDSFGRELNLTWADPTWSNANTPASVPSKIVSQIVLPDATTLDYAYGTGSAGAAPGWSDRLQQIKHKAASGTTLWGRSYLYENANLPYGLTGILDQTGQRLSTYAYNSIGYAISTERSNGVGKNTIQYLVDPTDASLVTRRVTNELGRRTDYVFKRDSSDVRATPRRLISITGRATPNLPGDVQTFDYDVDNLLSGQTNARGAATAQGNDATAKRPTSETDAAGVSRTTEWHPTLDLPTRVIEPGRTIEYTYDTSGQRLSETQIETTTQTAPYSTNGDTRATTYSWSTDGRLVSINGPRPPDAQARDDVTSFTYDAQGNRLTMTNPLGHVTTYDAYDPNGRPATVTDPNGVIMALTYDGIGRVKTTTVKHPSDTALDATTSFDYDDEGRVIGLTLPDTAKLIMDYDLAGRLTSVRSEDGERVDYTYDAMSNVLGETTRRTDGSTSDAVARTFDEIGRLLTETLGPGRTSSWKYDKVGNVTRLTSPRGNALAQAFDPLDRLVSQTAPDGGKGLTAYDERDAVTRFTDAIDVRTSYIRNGFGDIIREISPDRGTSTFYYDVAGDLVRSIDGRGQRIDYTRDIMGRLLRKRPVGQPATENIDYTWDTPGITGSYAVGRLSRVDDVTGTTKLAYDHRGNILTRQQKLYGTPDFVSLRYAYDHADRVTRITYPSGRIVAYVRDAKGRVSAVRTKASTSVTAWTTVANGLTYEPFGSVRSANLGNGLRVANDLGNDSRLASRRLFRAAGGTNLSLLTYSYDADDNITAIIDGLDASKSANYFYDSVGRLSRVDQSDGRTDYAYDVNGNRTAVERRALPSDPQPASSDAYALAVGTNRLASVTTGSDVRSFGHDARGNLASETRPGGSAIGATYDAYARLTGYARTGEVALTHAYNGLDDRIATTRDPGTGAETRRYVYAPDGRVLGEYGSGATDVRAEFIWLTPDAANDDDAMPFGGDDGMGGYAPLSVSVNDNAGGTVLNWVHGNHLGVPLVTTDGSGSVTTPTGYDLPGFPGQSRTLADLYYNRYRDYEPTTGRYIQGDPIGLAGGDNPYLYAGGNPLGATDAFGLQTRWEYYTGLPDSYRVTAINAIAGASDAATLGATDWLRERLRFNSDVQRESTAYQRGEYAGEAIGLIGGGAGCIRIAERRLGNYVAYEHRFQTGTKYFGEGMLRRPKVSAREISRRTGDPHVSTDSKRYWTKRRAQIEESRMLWQDGGPRSASNYNRIDSPGTRFRK